MALSKNKRHGEAVSKIVEILKIDRRVVDFVTTHPFLFQSERTRDEDDLRAIRHRYLGIIAIRPNSKKLLDSIENKTDVTT